jgi:hypothetical protein
VPQQARLREVMELRSQLPKTGFESGGYPREKARDFRSAEHG